MKHTFKLVHRVCLRAETRDGFQVAQADDD